MEANVREASLCRATVTGHVAGSMQSAYSSPSRLMAGEDQAKLFTPVLATSGASMGVSNGEALFSHNPV